MSSIRRIAALAAGIAALGAAGAQADTIGTLPAGASSNTSCSDFTVWQMVPSRARSTPFILTGWSTYQSAGSTGRSLRLKILHPVDATHWQVVAESPSLDVGTTEGVKTQALSITIAPGDFAAISGAGADCYYTDSTTNQLDGSGGPDPAVGSTITDDVGPSPGGLTLDLQLTGEPDADGDGFGDQTQDSCPTDPAIHTGPCQADLSVSATVTPLTIGVGDLAVMSGTVSNAGTSSAMDTVLHAATGSGLQIVNYLPGAGCTFTTDLGCPLGALGKGATVPFVVVVKGTQVGAQAFSASVAGSTADPNPANNSVPGTVTVEQRVPLVCTVPSLKGLSRAFAKKLLAATHCKLGKVTRHKAKKGKRGTVIRQAKKAKSVLPAGSKVAVTLKK